MTSAHMLHVNDPEELQRTVDRTVAFLEEFRIATPFHFIALTGLSGASVGYPVAYKMGISTLYIRKAGVQSHGETLEGIIYKEKPFIILDDLVASGTTVKRLLNTARNFADIDPYNCKACVLYNKEWIPSGWLTIGRDLQIPLIPIGDYTY